MTPSHASSRHREDQGPQGADLSVLTAKCAFVCLLGAQARNHTRAHARACVHAMSLVRVWETHHQLFLLENQRVRSSMRSGNYTNCVDTCDQNTSKTASVIKARFRARLPAQAPAFINLRATPCRAAPHHAALYTLPRTVRAPPHVLYPAQAQTSHKFQQHALTRRRQ